jgi:hypothetical protein
MNAKLAEIFALTALLLSVTGVAAQIPPPTATAPVPHPNPSGPLVVPAPGTVPVSPTSPGTSLGSRSATGFWYGPDYLPPIGRDLRLTIVSTDDNDPTKKSGGDADKSGADVNTGGGNADATPDDHRLESIREMFAALRACWVPPPKDQARHGMEYTIRFAFKRDGDMIAPPRMTYSSHDAPFAVRDVYRDAVNATLGRCTPLHFSRRMGGAVAGRPIAIRFVDDRTIDNGKDRQ